MDKPLSVGVVGVCENRLYAICACDQMLTHDQQAADVGASKMMFYGDWIFIFAGALSSTDLTVEEIRLAIREDDKALTRENIQTTLRRAYNNHVAHWNELRHLVSLGLTMREFNSPDGTKRLGSKLHYEIGCSMHQDYEENFSDEILVLGWGKMPHSVMLYSIGPGGEGLHGNDGCYAIGSGRDAAISTLFLLEHKASSHLQDAIYAVAAAKFSSESHGIGKSTTMWIARKRIDTDPADHPPHRSLLNTTHQPTRGTSVWIVSSFERPDTPTRRCANDIPLTPSRRGVAAKTRKSGRFLHRRS